MAGFRKTVIGKLEKNEKHFPKLCSAQIPDSELVELTRFVLCHHFFCTGSSGSSSKFSISPSFLSKYRLSRSALKVHQLSSALFFPLNASFHKCFLVCVCCMPVPFLLLKRLVWPCCRARIIWRGRAEEKQETRGVRRITHSTLFRRREEHEGPREEERKRAEAVCH